MAIKHWELNPTHNYFIIQNWQHKQEEEGGDGEWENCDMRAWMKWNCECACK